MKLCFDSVDELKAFVKNDLKAKRSGTADVNEDAAQAGNAPTPLAPPAGGAGFPGAGFAPQAPGATAGGAFLAAGAIAGPASEIVALVNRITVRIDGAIGSGQPADQVLAWFRGQCGPEAANATMDQIKQSFLPKLPQPSLENIAKLMNA